MKTYIVCKRTDGVGVGHYFLAWSSLFERFSLKDIPVLIDLRTSNLQYKFGNYLPTNEDEDYLDILYATDHMQAPEKFVDYEWIVKNIEKKAVSLTDNVRVLLVKNLSHFPYSKFCDFAPHISKIFTDHLSDTIFPKVDCVLHIRTGDSHLISRKIDEEKFGSNSFTKICSMIHMWVEKLDIDTKAFHCIGDNDKVVEYVRNTFDSCVSWHSSEPISHSMNHVSETTWSDGMSILNANRVVTLSAYDWGSNFTKFWASIGKGGNAKCKHYKLIPETKKMRCISKKKNGKRCMNHKVFCALKYPKEYKCNYHFAVSES